MSIKTFLTSAAVFASAAFVATAPAQAQVPSATDPRTVLQVYLDAVNSDDFEALTNLLSTISRRSVIKTVRRR